jgi:hypothetical protein
MEQSGQADGVRRTAKISSLDAARSFYFIIAALAVRQALLFLSGSEGTIPPGFSFLVRLVIGLAFVFTVFRYSHGVALVYDLEKKTAETSTTPSSTRVELVFASLVLEVAALFLMSAALGRPHRFVYCTTALIIFDLLYICVSKTLRDAGVARILTPWYFVLRWRSTTPGTASRAHVQWALSDYLVAILFLITLFPRARWLPSPTGSPEADWALVLSFLLILVGFIDYKMNGDFYFGKRRRGRKLVFVCSPLKAGAAGGDEEKLAQMRENIRRAQWYCRELYVGGSEIPFAPHGFYPYFLDDTSTLERKIGTKCALEFLAHCDAIYVYTASGAENEAELSQGMREELQFGKRDGLEIVFRKANAPPESFGPVWGPLSYAKTAAKPADVGQVQTIDLECSWKRVFVCTALRQDMRDSGQLQEAIKKNIRLAQWLCHELVRGEKDCQIAPVAPQAFFPYFTTFEENSGRLDWLRSALDILRTCDAIYVYTQDGLETDGYISDGMRQCIEEARDLGIEVKFRQSSEPPAGWQPQVWGPLSL